MHRLANERRSYLLMNAAYAARAFLGIVRALGRKR